MPFYRYSAVNGSGGTVDGTVEAATPDEAVRTLGGQGLKVRQIIAAPGPAQTAPQAQRPAPQRPEPPRRSQIQQPIAQTPAPVRQVIHTISPSAPAPIVHTKAASDKDRFFLFSQMAAQFRAGINPATAFTQLAQNAQPQFAASLSRIAAAVSEGASISDVMALYPDLYPRHVVGTVRAGEQGGFLPEALETVAGQAEHSHKFKRWFWWVWIVSLNSLLSIPVAIWAAIGLLQAWDATNGPQASGNASSSDVWRAFGQKFLWPTLPLMILTYVAAYFLRKYLSSRQAENIRHWVGHRFPVFNKRTRHEGLSVFAWTASKLAKSGLSPARTWSLAAESVPNNAMRDEMVAMGLRLNGSEKLSDIVRGSPIFTEEYMPLIATAEVTGDIPGTLDRLSQASRTEFETAETYAKMRSGCWGALGCLVTAFFGIAVICWVYYRVIPSRIESDTDDPQVQQSQQAP